MADMNQVVKCKICKEELLGVIPEEHSIASYVYDLRAKLAAAEHRTVLLESMVDEYQREIIPGFRECAEKAERDRDAERAHNVILREALERSLLLWDYGADYGYLSHGSLDSQKAWDEGQKTTFMINHAIETTPSDSAERVKRMTDLLGDTLTDCNMSVGMRSEIERVLREWRGE